MEYSMDHDGQRALMKEISRINRQINSLTHDKQKLEQQLEKYPKHEPVKLTSQQMLASIRESQREMGMLEKQQGNQQK